MDTRVHKQGARPAPVRYRGPSPTAALGHPDNVERDEREAAITAQVALVRARILAHYPNAPLHLQRPPRLLSEEEIDEVVESALVALAESESTSATADDWTDTPAQKQKRAPNSRDDDWRAQIDRIAWQPAGTR